MDHHTSMHSNPASGAFSYDNPVIPMQSLLYRAAKRAMDILLSAAAIIVLSPVMLLLCLIIRLDSPGPALFVHHRIGKNGKPLSLLKFRSMYWNPQDTTAGFTPEQYAEWEHNFKLNDDPRITRVGHILRRTSLDELPQIFNIFIGNLSIIGPRPIIDLELQKYGPFQEKFLSVKPGLGGYWQAYARSDCSYEQRMGMELYYIDHASFLWDIKLMFATVVSVLRGRGAM